LFSFAVKTDMQSFATAFLILRASALVSIVKIKFLCHVFKLIIYFKSDIFE
jgi:hypothetical protein